MVVMDGMRGIMDEIGDNIYGAVSEAAWGDAQSQQMADAKHEKSKEMDKQNPGFMKTVSQNFMAGVHSQKSAMNEERRMQGRRPLPKVAENMNALSVQDDMQMNF